ncbi:MAG: polyphosphate polymerase domain-containing protein [Verrucomicrobia subdivision 3 bacterium]|nr:polyphosphate polymerase domain-containing protein [Limisphaerales bacterium]
MAKDKMQASRFEQKYIITEEQALQIRDFVRSYLELDENGVGKPNYSYPVHSLYLDSDDLKLYWSTINGDKNRFKLRLRFYNNNPDTPVFFEIKRRMNNCIMKKRGGVRREAVDWLLAGHIPEPSHLVSKDPKHLHALQDFSRFMSQYRAKPKAHIGYFREAYVPHDDNSARLTMDREVRAEPELTARLSTKMENPILVWGREVVLELKFTNRFPDWFRDLVRIFGLRQCGAAKYVDGVARLGEYKLDARRIAQFGDTLDPRFQIDNYAPSVPVGKPTLVDKETQ